MKSGGWFTVNRADFNVNLTLMVHVMHLHNLHDFLWNAFHQFLIKNKSLRILNVESTRFKTEILVLWLIM